MNKFINFLKSISIFFIIPVFILLLIAIGLVFPNFNIIPLVILILAGVGIIILFVAGIINMIKEARKIHKLKK